MLYEDRIADLNKLMFQWKMNAEDTRTACELVHQSEAKRKQVPQSKANVC